MDINESDKILTKIEQGYDLIADKFSSTRSFWWRDLEFVKDYVRSTDKVLDFGCGNGRLAGLLKDQYKEFVGVDISQKLINIAKQRYSNEKTEFIKIDSRFEKLPFGDNFFDVVFSIAVFHHFPSREYTLKIAKELQRVMKPGGRIIMSVWNLWQEQYLKYHKKSKKEWIDAEIPFKSGEKIFHRYHHPFQEGELKKLLEKSGFEIQSRRKNYNIICIASKK
jgi:tRNA (uracil-5-)-methyltransferase TRM9